MTDYAQTTSARILLAGLTVHHLRFTVQAVEPLSFFEQPGSALRGGLYRALSDHFCSESSSTTSGDHVVRCPVCWLMALEDPLHQRGRDVARPLTIQPPERSNYAKGERLTFGISLIGEARDLLPYVVRAVEWMGENGVGKGRGRFRLNAVHEYSPLWDVERLLMDGSTVNTPTLEVNAARIADRASALAVDRITIHFLTPTRLTADGKLMKIPDPAVTVARLIERCQNLSDHYGEQDAKASVVQWKAAAEQLTEQAARLSIAYHEIAWIEAMSGSKRQGRTTPISGFTGAVRWQGELTLLREWLLWGQSLHVGKDAVKGNGWYRIIT